MSAKMLKHVSTITETCQHKILPYFLFFNLQFLQINGILKAAKFRKTERIQ